MPTPVIVGTEVKEIDLSQLFPPDEGAIDDIYGMIGSGKTYVATCDVLEDLKRGLVVYASWKIKWDGYDQRNDKIEKFKGLLGKSEFYKFDKTNLHHVDIFNLENIVVDGQPTGLDFTHWMEKLTDCKVYLDEGHVAFDSYDKTKMDMNKRNLGLLTRHLDRSIVLISQRPIAIHASIRSQVNRFYKMEKIDDYKIFGRRFQTFRKTEIQQVTNDGLPDETKVKVEEKDKHGRIRLIDGDEYQYAVSTKEYHAKKEIFGIYDSKYRRQGIPSSQPINAHVFHMTYKDRLHNFFRSDKLDSNG